MRTLILIAALTLAVALPSFASAKNAPGVVKTGKCSNGASWKLKAKSEDGRIEVEFEVDQNVNGRRWNVGIKRNGVVVFRGVRVTKAPSGSFEVVRRIRNAAGDDRIVGTAKAAAGGSCRGALTF
jgi:hypothetical protein